MATNGTNGVNGHANGANGTKSKFDPNFTQHVIDLMSPETKPRHRQVLGSLIKHLHDFCRDVELTQEDLVDEINHTVETESGVTPTSSTILGPFWSPETPFRDLGASVVQNMPKDGQLTYFHGVIKDAETGKGIPDAVFDMWQASTNGKYDVFDPENQTRHNLRGKFKTDAEGKFYFYCLKPTEYAIDTSGPSADLLKLMGRHPYRPAHIHMMVTHPDFIGVTAQLYPSDDPYLETDTACAVKDDLLLTFKPVQNEAKGATLDVEYDVRLVSKKYKPDSQMLMQNANQNKF
ncbi:hypothetical protein COL5a_002901 [Colletotrichum fioriniae]|nr:hypothetical protein COL5a_002901 [Colletotrichum fioriniae]